MKTYPYQTPEGIIQLVEKRELDQLLERLAEARESHLHASARDVQTIQRQAILLERLAGALRAVNSLGSDEFIGSDKVWSDASVAAFHESITALAAHESANLEPVARLIAAAPDLLEALEKCAAVIGAPQEGHWATDDEVNDAYDSAVAAINKAKGEQL